MKTYRGRRLAGTTDPGPVTVRKDRKTYALTQRWNWTGFNWGYYGSSPKHLAFALLADATGDDISADKHCQSFKDTVVSQLPDDWSLTDAMVRDWLLSQNDDFEGTASKTKAGFLALGNRHRSNASRRSTRI